MEEADSNRESEEKEVETPETSERVDSLPSSDITENDNLERNYDELFQQYEEGLAKRDEAEETNKILQEKICAYFMKRQFAPNEELLNLSAAEQEEKYEQLLENIDQVEKEIQDFKATSEKEMFEFESQIKEKELAVNEIDKEYYDLLKNIALRAVNSATGEHIPKEKVTWYLSNLKEAEEEKRKAHFEYLKEMKNLMDIKAKEHQDQGDDLSMTLNEYELMISETNLRDARAMEKKKEVSQMQRSCADAVNVITQLKHKLHFLREDKQVAKAKLKQFEEENDKMTRELLAKKTIHEHTVKLESQELKKKFMMIQDEALPEDYEQKKELYDQLTIELEDLKDRYNQLTLSKNSQNK